ncbi:MAG: protein phosphatase 2C domain-containing protein [Bacteroidales bacterium]|nr:protein phosphatase 2C domain-containing protein [Bacteroidales bacterium]
MKIKIKEIHSFRQIGGRANQEDSRYPDMDNPQPLSVGGCFAVCDGVGGEEKGEVASGTVCAAIGKALGSRKWEQPFTDDDLQRMLSSVYDAIEKASNSSNDGMATTLTFVAFHGAGVTMAHMGDSRIYHIRPGKGILYRSEDHSLVNALIRSGNITPEAAVNHPKRNVITRCITRPTADHPRDEASVIHIPYDVEPGDYFLLCTDGVHGTVDDATLSAILSEPTLTDEQKAQRLAERCASADDNNTAIIISIAEVTDRQAPPEQAPEPKEEVSPAGAPTERFNRREEVVHEVSGQKPQGGLRSIFGKIFKK